MLLVECAHRKASEVRVLHACGRDVAVVGQSSEAIITGVTQIAFFVNRPGKECHANRVFRQPSDVRDG
eukprot:4490372-Prymnesium_polylepis.1